MKVELERSFPMAASAEAVWRVLQNVEAVAGCMPGAKIAERIDERHFKGTVSVRVGPATMTFRGDVEVRDVDAAARSLRLVGKGTDSTGTSGASMDLAASVQGAGAESVLVGKSEVAMSGKAAAFGGRLMNTVADQVLKQFAANFAALVAQAPAESAPGAASEAPGPRDGANPASSRPLNALGLLWAIIKDWLRGLFGRSAA
ncbi:MAG TPA: SRPBCC family protein [Burkholderiaceae bacterium]|nr:SRPBCC family protein [Burkholderiaceae bacterium]